MNPVGRRAGVGLGLLFALSGARAPADDTPPKPDLTGYKTVAEARTRSIAPAKPGHAGETGYLGVSLIREGQGELVVDEVQPGSPAAKAGIEKGDVLTHVEGEVVKSPEMFRDALQMRGSGEPVKLALTRQGKAMDVQATLASTSRPRVVGGPRAYLGVVLGQAKDGEGVKIDEVVAGSPAAEAGFKAGDLLMQIEGVELTRPGKLNEVLDEKKPGDTFELTVRRGTEELALKPKLAVDTGAGGPGAGRGNRPGGGGGMGAMTIPVWTKPEFRVAVIGIEFPDVKHNAKVSTSDWEHILLGEGAARDKKEGGSDEVRGSLNDYFGEQSAGAFRLSGKVFEWVEVAKKRPDYILGSGTTNITAVLVEALEKIATRDGKDVFKDFDGFLFLYAGDQVRGNRGGVYFPHAGMIRNFQSKRWTYMFIPEGESKPTPIGGFAKEFGQMLGLPDLAARTENRGSEGLGAWDLLSNPLKTSLPQHLGAWSKEKLGWIQPTVIDPTVPQKLILGPIEGSPRECFKVLVRADGSEYFLLENRRKSGFDKNLPSEGLLIWRVVRDRPILEESHGVEGPSGPSVHLDAVPYPSPSNHAFTPETTPSSKSPLGGGLPVSITNIRRLDDGRVTFQIGYEYR